MAWFQLVAEHILFYKTVIIFIRSACSSLLGRLLNLARTQQSDAFVIGECPILIKLVYEYNLAHLNHLDLQPLNAVKRKTKFFQPLRRQRLQAFARISLLQRLTF